MVEWHKIKPNFIYPEMDVEAITEFKREVEKYVTILFFPLLPFREWRVSSQKQKTTIIY